MFVNNTFVTYYFIKVVLAPPLEKFQTMLYVLGLSVDESARIWLAFILLLLRVPIDRSWQHLTPSVSSTFIAS